ncbi:MAG: hypothetical protein JJU15_20850 [Pararhodobacter sp.]|nr:hypothetical protein [Pararhodobacter sp.]
MPLVSGVKQLICKLEAHELLALCGETWEQRGFLPLHDIENTAPILARGDDVESTAQRLMLAFNGARPVQARISQAARSGDGEAKILETFIHEQGLNRHPCSPIPRAKALELEGHLIADPASFLSALSASHPYPGVTDEECLAFDGEWAKDTLGRSRERLKRFIAARNSDTAVLVGNGPSLAEVDFGLLEGQDVYISNYAIRDAQLHQLARGVAVSNRFVASQAPHLFQTTPLWKFHPLWLGDVLRDTPETIYLNGVGGTLFFSEDVTKTIAWHSTVTFFWLQILFSVGYRKVCLIGVDNAYRQHADAREGDLIQQTAPDENHFFPDYFRGKVWQAADTGKMADTYRLARHHYEADGREIVNCTIGGSLEVFRRAPLADELPGTSALNGTGNNSKTQDLLAARHDVLCKATKSLIERAPSGKTSTGYALLGPKDPVRALHQRVSAFVKSLDSEP